MMYDDLVQELRYLAKVYSICQNESTQEYKLAVKAADAIEELRKAVLRLEDESGIYDELPTFYIYPTKWIPVTERLPDYDEVVQITDGIAVGHGYLEGVNTTVGIALLWHSPFCDIDEEHITHWMPLPEPPKEET